MILDAHMHVDDIPALGWKMDVETCIRQMDVAGIDRGVIMTITDLPQLNPGALEMIAQACARYPDRLWAYARMHPWYGDEAEALLERAFTEFDCFKGLKLHPVTTLAHPSGEDTLRLIRVAVRHHAPTMFHCGDEPLTTPLAVAQCAAAVPEATVVLGHMGGYQHVDEAIEVAERLPNIVLETSAMPYPHRIREAVGRIGAERVVYASDGPVCSPRIEVDKVRLAGLGAEAERLVLGENSRRMLEGVR